MSPSARERREYKQTVKLSRIFLCLATVIAVAGLIVLPVSAFTYGGGSTQGYAADTQLDNGTIVLLTGENSNRVKIATKDQVQNMFGVTVDRNQLPVTITSGLENEVFVAVSGTYNVLVSTQGGEIKSGDYVTLSSINGVAMNAGIDKTTVFGRANEAFDGKSVILGTAPLKDDKGNTTQTVKLGMVPVTIDIRSNPNDISTKVKVPEPLERLGQAIAEKEVNPIRIYISLGIMAVSIITALVMLYAGVRNAIIAIGRNPMSKRSIFRALAEIILTSILILIIGLFAVYLLLRL
jgi:hypothetical protein